jgi:RsiW-degrading membrane proteinase PrsW (M82 family)
MTSSDPTASTPDLTASAGVPHSTPASAPADVAVQATATAQPGLTAPPKRSSALLALGIVGVILVSVVMLFVIVYLISGLGGDAFALGGIMALIPLAIVFIAVRWIDRWEPEPRLAVIFAFLWGAGVAVLIALLVGAEIDNVIAAMGGVDDFTYEFFGAAVQAPIVEETGKGLGLLILFWVARKHFDGPVDGLVYAAWVAGGFAFTENILYFGSQLLDSGGFDGNVFEIFLIRGIMSPFAHVMFTACTGAALGFAARRTGAFGAIGFFLLGLIPAILLHALWNGALFFVSDFYGYYAIVQFPLFVIAVVLVIFLRRQESKLTHDRLAEYASVGWFNPDEVSALATPNGRRQALNWAAQKGKRKQMKRYIQDATRLAFARQRIITGRGRPGAEADEAALLGAIVESRKALVGVGATTP